jgi:hypothetical protein
MLQDCCGPKGFHFIVGGPAAEGLRNLGPLVGDDEGMEDDDLDDEDDFDEAPPRLLGF